MLVDTRGAGRSVPRRRHRPLGGLRDRRRQRGPRHRAGPRRRVLRTWRGLCVRCHSTARKS